MAGESQQLPQGSPDPSVFTTEALTRGLNAERDYVDGQLSIRDEKLKGIDKATELLNQTVTKVPTEVQKEVSHLREIVDIELRSIQLQFTERDQRTSDNAVSGAKALDAALAAQKEAASEQNKSNTLAISKSEGQTTESINKLSELFQSTISSQNSKIDDLKDTIKSLELDLKQSRASHGGSSEAVKQTVAYLIAAVGIAVALATLVIRLAG